MRIGIKSGNKQVTSFKFILCNIAKIIAKFHYSANYP